MSKPIREIAKADAFGRISFLKRDLIALLSWYIKTTNMVSFLKHMSLEEMADRFEEMYGNSGKTIYVVQSMELEGHFFQTFVTNEVLKRIKAKETA
jgi:hypothetical protein